MRRARSRPLRDTNAQTSCFTSGGCGGVCSTEFTSDKPQKLFYLMYCFVCFYPLLSLIYCDKFKNVLLWIKMFTCFSTEIRSLCRQHDKETSCPDILTFLHIGSFSLLKLVLIKGHLTSRLRPKSQRGRQTPWRENKPSLLRASVAF